MELRVDPSLGFGLSSFDPLKDQGERSDGCASLLILREGRSRSTWTWNWDEVGPWMAVDDDDSNRSRGA